MLGLGRLPNTVIVEEVSDAGCLSEVDHMAVAVAQPLTVVFDVAAGAVVHECLPELSYRS
jgi:hypothetical protein